MLITINLQNKSAVELRQHNIRSKVDGNKGNIVHDDGPHGTQHDSFVSDNRWMHDDGPHGTRHDSFVSDNRWMHDDGPHGTQHDTALCQTTGGYKA